MSVQDLGASSGFSDDLFAFFSAEAFWGRDTREMMIKITFRHSRAGGNPLETLSDGGF